MIADHMLDTFGGLSSGEALAYNSALEYAAKWIEYSAKGDPDGHIVQWAANQAMSIRAAKQPIEQENFFDALRADADMTPEQKAYWLAFERDLNALNEGLRSVQSWADAGHAGCAAFLAEYARLRATVEELQERNERGFERFCEITKVNVKLEDEIKRLRVALTAEE